MTIRAVQVETLFVRIKYYTGLSLLLNGLTRPPWPIQTLTSSSHLPRYILHHRKTRILRSHCWKFWTSLVKFPFTLISKILHFLTRALKWICENLHSNCFDILEKVYFRIHDADGQNIARKFLSGGAGRQEGLPDSHRAYGRLRWVFILRSLTRSFEGNLFD